MEILEIAVDLKSLQAIQGLQAFVRGLNETNVALSDTAAAVAKVDTSFDAAGAAATGAGKRTAAAGDEIKKAGDKAAEAARHVDRTGDRARAAAAELYKAGRDGRAALGGIADTAGQAGGLVSKLVGEVKGLGLSYLGLQGAINIVRELQEQTGKAIDARRQLADQSIARAATTADLIDNLGLPANAQGNAAAARVVADFRRRAPASAEQAVSILSQAQSTGFQVFDAGTGKVDEEGMGVAQVVGQFAARTRLDPSTAGKLFVIARNAGVRTPGQMEGLLAQVEAALQSTPIEKASDALPAMIRAVGARLAQGVPFNQAVAQFGAAAATETSPEAAATNVMQFSRVAAGLDDKRTAVLARLARDAGLIRPADTAKERAAALAAFEGTHGRALADRLREADQLEKFGPEQERREAEKVRELEARRKVAKTPEARRELDEDLKRARIDAERRRRDDRERIADVRADVADARAKAEKEAEAAALIAAYKRIPIARRESLVADAAKGMTPQQLSQFAGAIAEGDMLSAVVTQLGPAGQDRRAQILSSARNPAAVLPGYRDRTSAFLASSPLAGQAFARAQAEAEAAAASPAGGAFANQIEDLARGRVKALEAEGRARTGAVGFLQSLTGDATSAYSADAVEADQARALLWQYMGALGRDLSPAQRAKWGPKLAELGDRLAATVHWRSGPQVKAEVRRVAEAFGAIRDQVRDEAQRAGAPLPGDVAPGRLNWTNESLPAFDGTALPAAPTGTPGPGVSDMPSQGENAPQTGGTGRPRSVSYHHTVHIGNYFSAASDQIDLAGRLESDV